LGGVSGAESDSPPGGLSRRPKTKQLRCSLKSGWLLKCQKTMKKLFFLINSFVCAPSSHAQQPWLMMPSGRSSKWLRVRFGSAVQPGLEGRTRISKRWPTVSELSGWAAVPRRTALDRDSLRDAEVAVFAFMQHCSFKQRGQGRSESRRSFAL